MTNEVELYEHEKEPAKPPVEREKLVFADVQFEYALAVGELMYLKPQYEEAVARYKKARNALREVVADNDDAINIF